MVPGAGFEPASARLQRAAITRFANQANWSGRWEVEPIVPTLATWCSAIELRPHGGKWTESNLWPARDRFYSAATAPACPYWHFPSSVASQGIEPCCAGL